jgi:type III restriction enzyme
MYLKKYQQRVVSELKTFFTTAQAKKTEFDAIVQSIPEAQRQLVASSMNYVDSTFSALNLPYTDNCKNGLNTYYPRFNLKVPTGGGKTILAVEAIKEYQSVFAQRKTGLVVWIVPKEIIYKQTVQRLRDKGHPYRQLLDQASGGRTIIAEKGQKLTKQDVDENLVILFIMAQSVNRKNTTESLKVFKDSGGFDSFFPADNRYDLHHQWLTEVPNLDTMWTNGEQSQLITSLGNAVRVSKPFIIIDEFHKVFTATAKATIDNLNPEMILGLSATPKEGMNNLTIVKGLELKEEEMVKLDLHIIPPTSTADDDWQAMMQNIMAKRQELEDEAIALKQDTGQYIRPIALIQCERTGKDQRGRGFVHSEDVKAHLIDEGVNPNEIAIKSSSTNDIEDENLFSRECPIRFIITRDALNEGWDCSFAYVLGIIPNVSSNTGVTQLIGRILRQPQAKKTGITALDESYVYYSKGNTSDLLKKVVKGFEEEGLGDLVSQMKVAEGTQPYPKKTVKIKDEFQKYEYAFYLPLWVMVDTDGKNPRKFNYATDISQHIDFESLLLTEEVLIEVEKSLSEENSKRSTFSVTIDDESKIKAVGEEVDSEYSSKINSGYMSRRVGEYISNPFLARKKTLEWTQQLQEKLGEKKLAHHFSFIASQVAKYVASHKSAEEERLFSEYLDSEKIKLSVSDQKEIGFRVPASDLITTNVYPSDYKHNLYEDVENDRFTSLEKDVISILEKEQTTLFWFRNKVAKGWYNIQGWKQNKIYPDFVVAKKKENDEVEILYVIESKGQHLVGNDDSLYKDKVMKKMTEQHEKKKIKTYSTQLQLSLINDKVAAYFIKGGDEDVELKTLMK